MTTLVCFHAHPDDEAIATGGVMVQAVAAGHRVVLVVATRGECGEVAEGVLAPGETLGERRTRETLDSAAVLGVHRVEFLGYRDSGMVGEPTNDDPACFWQASVDEAAERLATILREESAGVLTIYDDHGGYGHPDHIQVHRVGVRAAELAGVDRVFEATMNQDEIRRNVESMRSGESDVPELEGVELPDIDDPGQEFGSPEVLITHAVDVSEVALRKRDSMRCHATQITDESFFLAMPEHLFVAAFGTEWFIRHGAHRSDGAPFETSLFS